VAAQVALAAAMVVPALLLVRSYRGLNRIDVGVISSGTITASLSLPVDRYADVARVSGFYESLFTQLAARSVDAAGAMSFLPIQAGPGGDGFMIEGRPELAAGDAQPSAGYYRVTPGVFRALGVPLRAGRGLDARDRAGSPPVAVVNEAAARTFWPNEDPVGRRIRYYDEGAPWVTIVGVVADVRGSNVTEPAPPAVFTPLAQNIRQRYGGGTMQVVVRSARGVAAARSALVDAARAVDARAPLSRVRPLAELTRENVGPTRFASQVLGGFAVAATVLGLIGVYGVVASVVRQRRREIGVRVALGATRRRVVGDVLRTAIVPILGGVVAGSLGAVLLARAFTRLLYGVGPADPATFAGVGLLLTLTALAACLGPALRASRIDPQEALRQG
jgi:predicted permease